MLGERVRRVLIAFEQETSKESNVMLRWRLVLAEFICVSALVVVLGGAWGLREAVARFV